MDSSQVEKVPQMVIERTAKEERIFDHRAGKSERTPFDRSHYSTGNADIVGWLIVISLFLLCIGGRQWI